MKYSKNLKRSDNMIIENVNYHRTVIKKLGKVNLTDPKTGDLKLSVMPFENNGKWVELPEGFKQWEKSLNDILEYVPLQDGSNTHYVTIDTKFFTTDEFLRREGVHMDGNFCVDPYFSFLGVNEMASWGGASPKPIGDQELRSWGGASPKPIGDQEANGTLKSWGGASPKTAEDEERSWARLRRDIFGESSPKPIGDQEANGTLKSWGGASPKTAEDEERSWARLRRDMFGESSPKDNIKSSDVKSWREWLDSSEKKSSPGLEYKIIKGEDGICKMIRESHFQEMSDNSHVKMDWILPYDIVIPISEYVSGDKGGILTVSTEIGCQAWNGDFYGNILSEGSFENMTDQLTDDRKVILEKNQLYFMSSNTPHETLLIEKGKRRTFLRITLNHNYDNSLIGK